MRSVLKWVLIIFVGLFVIGSIIDLVGGGDDDKDDKGKASQSTSEGSRSDSSESSDNAAPATPAAPAPTARQRLNDALDDVHAHVENINPGFVLIETKTPGGGFQGPSTGDELRIASSIFKIVYGDVGLHRKTDILFRGGLVNSKTGQDLPDAKTGSFEMTKSDAEQIDWSDDDVLFSINWALFRTFAHPALKDDDGSFGRG